MSSGTTTLPVHVVSTHSSSRMRDTTHLRLLAGESEAFRASNSGGCPWARREDNMVATNARVLFLWRQWVFGLCVGSHEEAFYLDDLQFLSLVRFMSWVWLWCGLLLITIGAVLLGAADASKPTPDTVVRGSRYSSSYDDIDSAMSRTYSALLAFGIILLVAGILCLVVFVIKHLSRGVYLSLNFSRKDVGIVDWYMRSWWKPRMSSTRRMIKLPKETALEAYNALNQMLHDRVTLSVKVRDPRARESAVDM